MLFKYVNSLIVFRYVVLTSKHHDGYALWPSQYSYSWNSVDIGPHRDIIGELSAAIKSNTSLRFGLYHSLYEWFNPMYLSDKAKNFEENHFVTSKVLLNNVIRVIQVGQTCLILLKFYRFYLK